MKEAPLIPNGVWPVMLTPFKDDGGIDWNGLDALVDWYLHAGVAGLFAVCLSSEMYDLSADERVQLAERVTRRVAGRVPVVAAGCFADGFAGQIDMVRRMIDTGVTAVVLTVNQLAGEDEAEDLWRARAEALFEACPDTPLGMYECPQPYHRLLSPEALEWVAGTGRVHFYKDTCCDLEKMRPKIAALAGTPLRWFNANGPTLLGSLEAGGRGYCGIAANYHPELFVRLCAMQERNHEGTGDLNHFLCVADAVARHRYPVAAKHFLALRGLPIGTRCRRRVGPLSGPDRISLEALESLTRKRIDAGN
jgi:4-hydroxy-tetrahydrodipicolinate synthase